jgi:hypothetical protein
MTHLHLNPIYAEMPVTVFEHMSGLARSLGAINLGQGFPDTPPPPAAHHRDARDGNALAAISGRAWASPNCAMPSPPSMRANRALPSPASRSSSPRRDRGDRRRDPAVVGTGDEVLLFSPAYDAYAPLVRRAGGMPVFVPPSLRQHGAMTKPRSAPRSARAPAR